MNENRFPRVVYEHLHIWARGGNIKKNKKKSKIQEKRKKTRPRKTAKLLDLYDDPKTSVNIWRDVCR